MQQSVDDDEGDVEKGFEVDDEEEGRYMQGRIGDHLMGACFECDVCNFRNLNKRDPVWTSQKDLRTLAYIRRASLDMFWSKESSTVRGNFNRLKRDWKEASENLSLGESLPTLGNPWLEDRNGLSVALVMLQASLRPGKYSSYVQFDTVRKSRSCFTHAHHSAVHDAGSSLFVSDGKTMRTSTVPTRSRWFERFCLGMKRRMGVIRKQDEALSSEQVKAILVVAEELWRSNLRKDERKELGSVITFVLIGFGASLRGEEIPLVSIRGMLSCWPETRESGYVMVALRGKFKTEDNERWHMVPIVDVTKSGIEVRKWITRLMIVRVREERDEEGPLFVNKRGKRARLSDYNSQFQELVELARDRFPGVFSEKALLEDYNLRRSMRRGSTTQATNNGTAEAVIDLMNRWRRKEHAKGAEPGLSMQQVYTEVRSAVEATLKYSENL